MPLLFIAIPLAAVLVLNLAFKWLNMRAALWSAILVCVAQIGLSVLDLCLTLRSGPLVYTAFVEKLSIDAFSAVVLLVIGMVSLISLVVARVTVKADTFNFVSMVMLIMLGMNGLAMVTDLFSLYVFVEATSAASFVLIGMPKSRDALEGAFKYYLVSALATVMMLTAIAFVFMAVGETDFAAVGKYMSLTGGRYPFEILAALILFIAGLAVKAGLVPFHAWVPDAYSASPAPVSVLLAGVVTKASGVYTLMRIYRDVFADSAAAGNVLMVLGVASILVGAFAAIGQKDMKRMLAYSSISQIGYILLGLGTGSALGFLGALFHFFNHASFKSLLFVDQAAIEMETGTRDMDRMGGLADKMPVTGVSSILAFLSTAGIPPLSGFWSKLLIILAVWQVSRLWAAVALVASLITLAYLLIMQRKVFFGIPPEAMSGARDPGRGIAGAQILLAVINVAVGVLFPLVLLFLQNLGMI